MSDKSLLQLAKETQKGLGKIVLDIGKTRGIVQISNHSDGTGIRWIDKRFFPSAKCLVCGKGLLDGNHVDEHRKTCHYNSKDYDKFLQEIYN